MAKPKLALIPAAQGSKLFSVLPSSGVGDFTFTRSGSATRINSQGLIETVDDGVSRLNYPMIDGKVVGCPHHILEPERTNLISYSEDFIQSYWTKQDSLITSNQAISPDGTLTADLYTTSSDVYDFVRRSFNFTSGNTHTLSVFVKSGTSNEVRLDFPSAFTDRSVAFNLENKTYTSVSGSPIAKIEDYGNGWFRCSITSTATSTSSGTTGFSSTKPIAVSTLYLWGAQIEQGSYPTSYIPTNGSAVTRSAETAYGSGDASTFNDSEGVLMAEISGFVDTDDYRMISINAGDSANTLFIALRNDTGNAYFYLISGGGIQANYISDVNATNTNLKLALKYKENDVSFYVNGIKLYEDTSATMISGLNQLDFNYGNANGSYPFYGSTKQIQYFDSALNDSDLEKLTSWTSFSDMANGQLYSVE